MHLTLLQHAGTLKLPCCFMGKGELTLTGLQHDAVKSDIFQVIVAVVLLTTSRPDAASCSPHANMGITGCTDSPVHP